MPIIIFVILSDGIKILLFLLKYLLEAEKTGKCFTVTIRERK